MNGTAEIVSGKRRYGLYMSVIREWLQAVFAKFETDTSAIVSGSSYIAVLFAASRDKGVTSRGCSKQWRVMHLSWT
jgi:hypothetical protein